MASQENNRNRATISISGIDTSTSSHSVEDGKCEELHNLRFASGSWHNVDPLKIKQNLHPAEGQEELFSKMTIIYHHPAAGDDTYIASVSNDDGTVDLFIATVTDGTLKIDMDHICPIYIDDRIIGNTETLRNAVYLVSLKPVESDISVDVTYRMTVTGYESNTSTLTIPKGSTESIGYINSAISEHNEQAKANPNKDHTYIYQVFENREKAEIHGGSFARNIPSDMRITHFGNVLIVMIPSEQRVTYYLLDGNAYRKFQIPASPVVRQSPDWSTNGAYNSGASNTRVECSKIGQYRSEDVMQGNRIPIYNITSGAFHVPQVSAEYFWGEVCFFAAFRMVDGSIVSPSALNIAIPEPFQTADQYLQYYSANIYGGSDIRQMNIPYFITYMENGEKIFGARRYPYVGYDSQSSILADLFYICPYITNTIPDDVDSALIESVVIYSTRINPIWDAEKLKYLNASESYESSISDTTGYLADNELPDQPFYFVKSIPLDDFTDGEYKMYLGGDMLDGIEHNSTYDPIDMHRLFYDVAKEYNSRMHIGGDGGFHLFEGYGSAFFPVSDSNPDYSILTNIRIDDRDYRVAAPSSTSLSRYFPVYNRIFSYPDYRATFMYESSNPLSILIKLKPAMSVNFAWAVNGHESRYFYTDDHTVQGRPSNLTYRLKYSASTTAIEETTAEYYEATDAVVPLNNKLRVSAANNPFSFPMANTYAIGSGNNRIIAVNSAAIEMSDAKFGEFPLYVFTEEGIFALQSGSGEILYSSTIPINYDCIINPKTLAVNYNILYITDLGIMAMSSEGVRLISEPVNDQHNTPPIEFLRTAYLCYHPAHNEVFVWNPEQPARSIDSYPAAYVYSLSGDYWSTRDMDGVKLNTNEMIVRDSGNHIRIIDIDNEESRSDQVIKVRIVSRPLKLGSTEYKRLETLVLRLHALEPQPIRIMIEGSTDLKTWITLRDTGAVSADRDVLLRRFPCSMCYLRLTLEASVASQLDLTRFDMEYYLRFHHRLR